MRGRATTLRPPLPAHGGRRLRGGVSRRAPASRAICCSSSPRRRGTPPGRVGFVIGKQGAAPRRRPQPGPPRAARRRPARRGPAIEAFDVILRAEARLPAPRRPPLRRRGRPAAGGAGAGPLPPGRRAMKSAAASRCCAATSTCSGRCWASNCRFYPSCSDYAREAIERHGAIKGSWLAARRIAALPPVSSRRLRPGALSPASRFLCPRRDAQDAAQAAWTRNA